MPEFKKEIIAKNISGIVNWPEIPPAPGSFWCQPDGIKEMSVKTEVRCGYNREWVYFSFLALDPHLHNIVRGKNEKAFRILGGDPQRGVDIVSVSFFEPRREEPIWFAANPNGGMCCEIGGWQKFTEWQVNTWVGIEGGWRVEIKIPWYYLPGRINEKSRVNFDRRRVRIENGQVVSSEWGYWCHVGEASNQKRENSGFLIFE